MSVLALDVGNTRTKWLLSVGDGERSGVFAAAVPSEQELLALPAGIHAVVCSSVRGQAFTQALEVECRKALGLVPTFFVADARWRSLINGYDKPEMLGVDRWLAMVAAWDLCASEVLVVDVGTAMTLDVIDASGQHQGGYIVPGYNTLVNSLNNGADSIQVPEAFSSGLGLGRVTAEAVHHGCLKMLLAMIEQERAQWPKAQLVLTGGGAKLLCQALPDSVIYRPDLVLEGLILRYQSGL